MNHHHDTSSTQQASQDVGAGLHALVRMLHVIFIGLRVLIVGIFVWLVFSGIFFVREHEEAMLFRFGKLVKKNNQELLTSGHWYWAWPYPIDRVQRISAQRSATVVTKQFWVKGDPNQQMAGSPEESALIPGQDGYLVTGDANIMHMLWSVTYRVPNAKTYYLNLYQDPETLPGEQPKRKRGAEAIIEDLLSNAVVQEVANWKVEDVLTISRRQGDEVREGLDVAVRQRLQKIIDKLDLGIELQQVSVINPQPPMATQNAFREVVDASQDYQTELEKAQAYASRKEAEVLGQSAKIQAEARAYKTRIVETVKANSEYFLKVLDEHRQNPETMLFSLYTDTLRDVLNRVENKYVIHSSQSGKQEVRLMLGPEPEKPNNSATQSPDDSQP
jgi:regulator of protease activity HflC (stomatin/prohibitin superfamily)